MIAVSITSSVKLGYYEWLDKLSVIDTNHEGKGLQRLLRLRSG